MMIFPFRANGRIQGLFRWYEAAPSRVLGGMIWFAGTIANLAARRS